MLFNRKKEDGTHQRVGLSDGVDAKVAEFVIREIEDGTRELSMGYTCDLDWTAGVSPSGEAYDAIQRGIRSNHIAVVPAARGGSELRIGDGANRKESQAMTDAERQTMKDSVKGMPLDQAAALPLYDGVRGVVTSGMPAERYFAILDGADAGRRNRGRW